MLQRLRQLGLQDLDRYCAIVPFIPREVDRGCRSTTELALDGVTARGRVRTTRSANCSCVPGLKALRKPALEHRFGFPGAL